MARVPSKSRPDVFVDGPPDDTLVSRDLVGRIYDELLKLTPAVSRIESTQANHGERIEELERARKVSLGVRANRFDSVVIGAVKWTAAVAATVAAVYLTQVAGCVPQKQHASQGEKLQP